MKRAVNIAEAARLARCSTRAVYHWVRAGLLSTDGAHWRRRIPVEALVERFLDLHHARPLRPETVDPTDTSVGEKFCSGCETVKSVLAFARISSVMGGGWSSRCKACYRAYTRAWTRRRKQIAA